MEPTKFLISWELMGATGAAANCIFVLRAKKTVAERRFVNRLNASKNWFHDRADNTRHGFGMKTRIDSSVSESSPDRAKGMFK
ncbi:hypothetical protein DL96DRAFT_1607576 [Flagelloscypha sp. PMI_526]|nr:hypothetical protein DL96DRAFT_1607576 [Flagelloscypha sp. PMI_526]